MENGICGRGGNTCRPGIASVLALLIRYGALTTVGPIEGNPSLSKEILLQDIDIQLCNCSWLLQGWDLVHDLSCRRQGPMSNDMF